MVKSCDTWVKVKPQSQSYYKQNLCKVDDMPKRNLCLPGFCPGQLTSKATERRQYEQLANHSLSKKKKLGYFHWNFLFSLFQSKDVWQIWFICASWTVSMQRDRQNKLQQSLWTYLPACFSCRPMAVFCKTDVIIIMQTNLTSLITHVRSVHKIWLVSHWGNCLCM